MGKPATNLTGQVFERLSVLKRDLNDKDGKAKWLCQCQCGNTRSVRGGDLKRGVTRSCGCLQREKAGNAKRTHGLSNTREYHSWRNMINRCYNPNDTSYHNYGLIGITVCDRWRHSFDNFRQDMGLSNGLVLDRIDKRKNYDPDNCKWSTRTEQQNNRNNTRNVTYQGETLSIAQLAAQVNLPYLVLYRRLNRGLSPEDAVAKL